MKILDDEERTGKNVKVRGKNWEPHVPKGFSKGPATNWRPERDKSAEDWERVPKGPGRTSRAESEEPDGPQDYCLKPRSPKGSSKGSFGPLSFRSSSGSSRSFASSSWRFSTKDSSRSSSARSSKVPRSMEAEYRAHFSQLVTLPCDWVSAPGQATRCDGENSDTLDEWEEDGEWDDPWHWESVPRHAPRSGTTSQGRSHRKSDPKSNPTAVAQVVPLPALQHVGEAGGEGGPRPRGAQDGQIKPAPKRRNSRVSFESPLTNDVLGVAISFGW